MIKGPVCNDAGGAEAGAPLRCVARVQRSDHPRPGIPHFVSGPNNASVLSSDRPAERLPPMPPELTEERLAWRAISRPARGAYGGNGTEATYPIKPPQHSEDRRSRNGNAAVVRDGDHRGAPGT